MARIYTWPFFISGGIYNSYKIHYLIHKEYLLFLLLNKKEKVMSLTQSLKKYYFFIFPLFLVLFVFQACEETSTTTAPEINIINPSSDAEIIQGAEVKINAQLNGFDMYHPIHNINFSINDSTYLQDTSRRQNISLLWRTDHLTTGEYQLKLRVRYSDETLDDKDWNYFNARDYIEEYIDGKDDAPDTIIAEKSVKVKLVQAPANNISGLSFETFAEDTFSYNSKTIILSSFKMSKYEITNAQFCSFLNAIGATEEGYYADIKYIHLGKNSQIVYENGSFKPKTNAETFPVTNVTWFGAKNFCRFAGGRLPTETEWYYCAMGTNTSNLDNIAWYKENSGNMTHKIGEKAANAKGLYDILGNAAEWCNDWYNETIYASSSDTIKDPLAPRNDFLKVHKGGHWYSEKSKVNPEQRFKENPRNGGNYLGFRMVRPE
jgi:hypothetical protein